MESFSCECCNKTFNGPAPYQQHMVSEKHRKKQVLFSTPVRNLATRNVQSEIASASMFSTPFLTNDAAINYRTGSARNVPEEVRNYCSLCGVTVAGEIDMVQHYYGKQHKAAQKHMNELEEFMKARGSSLTQDQLKLNLNALGKAASGGLVVCEGTQCGRPVSQEENLTNRLSINNKRCKENDEENLHYCSLCQVTFTSRAHAASHYAGKNHQKKKKAKNMGSLITMATTSVIQIHRAEIKRADGAATFQPSRLCPPCVVVVAVNQKLLDAKEGKVVEKPVEEEVPRRTALFVFPKKIMADADELKRKIKETIGEIIENERKCERSQILYHRVMHNRQSSITQI